MKKYLDNLRQYQFLLSELVKKGIKLKYRRSYLGILWSMLEPLLSMVVLTIVFGTLYGNTDKTIPVYKGLPPKNHIFLKKSLCFSRQKTSGNPSATDFAGKLPRLQLRAAMRTGRRTSVLMTGKHTADIHLKCLPSEPSVQIKVAQKNQKHWQ